MVSLPLAHCAVRALRPLRAATQNSIEPYNGTDNDELSPISSGHAGRTDEEAGLHKKMGSEGPEGQKLNSESSSNGYGQANETVSKIQNRAIRGNGKKLTLHTNKPALDNQKV